MLFLYHLYKVYFYYNKPALSYSLKMLKVTTIYTLIYFIGEKNYFFQSRYPYTNLICYTQQNGFDYARIVLKNVITVAIIS